jgi:hypothetical protein
MDLSFNVNHQIAQSLCGRSAEAYAEAALGLEPRGWLWCQSFGTVKAQTYRAFGYLLSAFEQRLCDFFLEIIACTAVELLPEWETEYGLPGNCAIENAQTIESRQAQVCAARRGVGIQTLEQLQQLLRDALQCSILEITFPTVSHSVVGGTVGAPLSVGGQAGICIKNIGPVGTAPAIHTSVGVSVARSLLIDDPAFVSSTQCPIIYSNAPGDYDPVRYPLLVCLLEKHLPAHIQWSIC